VTVNLVAPGYVRTGMLERDAALRAGEDGDGGQIMTEMAERVPLGRLGRPTDVADLVAWLLSDESGYITGQTIGVNGGLLLS
jgi:3-oxoacyl-[acyl-carrier protein] reductase